MNVEFSDERVVTTGISLLFNTYTVGHPGILKHGWKAHMHADEFYKSGPANDFNSIANDANDNLRALSEWSVQSTGLVMFQILILLLWGAVIALILGLVFAGYDTLMGPEYKVLDNASMGYLHLLGSIGIYQRIWRKV
nr:unnamed protein product [Callosobruchus analis]